MSTIVRRLALPLAVLGVACVGVGSAPRGEVPDYARQHYVKYEYRIPMRDGTKLFTAVYVPRDTSTAYPVLLNRTPYSVAPYGPDAYKTSLGPSDLFMRDGYVFAYQDVRGRLMSEGDFVDVRPYNPAKERPTDIDESTDTWDTIEWLVTHVPNNSGKVGLYGISYPGFYSAMGMIDAHPALVAVSPQAPIADWFIGDDFHHNGAVYLPHAFAFLAGFGWPRPRPTTQGFATFDFQPPDGFQFYKRLGPLSAVNDRYFRRQVQMWNDMVDHEAYDAFWKARNIRPHLKAIRPAVMTVGGWFDAEDLFGALETYTNTERQSPGACNTLVMGPWPHGGWSRENGDRLGDVRFGAKTSEFFRERIEFPFFGHFLKGRGAPDLPEAYVFETGRNEWHTLPAWPPREAARRPLYLLPGGRLAFEPAPESAAGYDEYVSDPADPVPYSTAPATAMNREYMIDDQRFVSQRRDVLVYQTEPLAGELTLAGPIWPRLLVSTSGTDSDFVVKLIDVYPPTEPGRTSPRSPVPGEPAVALPMAGYQQLVRGEVFRGKFRRSYEHPEPFTPNAPARIEYTMPDVFHTFGRGHRVMIQIQSSWFPLVNLNPQKFLNIPRAAPADFQAATERIYRGGAEGSRVDLNLLVGQDYSLAARPRPRPSPSASR
jgi:uncharacterized protein